MAGFFDTLLGLETDPRRRDYKLRNEITSPEELEAYRAGASATGIPGLDRIRSFLRGIGQEVSEPSMGPLGERYRQTMDDYRARQEAARRLQERYPEAFRAGRLGTVGNLPGAEAVFMAQPGIAGMAGAGRAGAREALESRLGSSAALPAPAPSILEGEFSEAASPLALGYQAPKAPVSPYYRKVPEAMGTSTRPMNAFQQNTYGMTTGRYGAGYAPEMAVTDFETYGPRSTNTGRSQWSGATNAFDRNAFEAWKRGRENAFRKRQAGQPVIGEGGEETARMTGQGYTPEDLGQAIVRRDGSEPAFNGPRSADVARMAREEYQTPRSTEMTTFRPRMPRSTLIEGEFSEVPGGGGIGGMPPRGPGGIGGIGGPEDAGLGSRLPMFARNAAGLAGGIGAYKLGQTAYDRAMDVLNRPPVMSEDTNRKVMLPPIDIRSRSGTSGPTAPSATAPSAAPKTRPTRKAAPSRAARAAEDNRRYWGDWRDVEPYASDPIGAFIDELTGQQKMARRPGTLASSGYADGGVARQYYDDGGSALGGLGDMIGRGVSNLTSGNSPVTGKPFHFGPISQGLVTAGLGMMSSPSHSLARAIGEGGIAGIKAYDVASQREKAESSAERESQENLDFERKLREGMPSPVVPVPVPTAPPKLRRGGVPKQTRGSRNGYAAGGGQSDDFGPFGEIGEAIGEGLQSLGDTIGSALTPGAQAAEAAPATRRGPGPISQGLLTAGLGMMASPSHSLARAIGEGGLRGVQAYQTAAQEREKEDRAEAQRASDMAFSKEITGGAPKIEAPVPIEAPKSEKEDRVVATDRPESENRVVATDQKAPAAAEDPVATSMRRIEWLNSHVPQNSTQERILNRMLNEEKFKIQMAQKQSGSGVIGIIDQDEFGRPRRGWISGPKAGQYLEQPGAAGAKPVSKDMHGNDFLTTLSPDMAGTVQAIAEGRSKMPAGPRAAQIRAAVYQYDPNYRESRYDVTQSLAKPAGANFGATIGSGNMAIKHLGEISDAVEDLKKSEWAGGKFRPLNWLQQTVKTNLPGGYPEVERFKTAADRFSEEATKFYRGSGGNQADIQRAIDRMNAARSPQELHDILEEETRLFSGKVKGLGAIYNQSFSSPYVDLPEFKPLEDTSNDIIDVIRKRASKPYSHVVHDISEKKSSEKSGPQPVATGDYNGRTVTKYSDGTIRDSQTGDILNGPQAKD